MTLGLSDRFTQDVEDQFLGGKEPEGSTAPHDDALRKEAGDWVKTLCKAAKMDKDGFKVYWADVWTTVRDDYRLILGARDVGVTTADGLKKFLGPVLTMETPTTRQVDQTTGEVKEGPKKAAQAEATDAKGAALLPDDEFDAAMQGAE
jgi:hypothetical protein